MAKKVESVDVTQEHIEEALKAESGPAPGMVGAFNPADFARKAAAIARIAAPFIAIAASTNWKSPVSAAKALVQLYALVLGTQDEPAPAA